VIERDTLAMYRAGLPDPRRQKPKPDAGSENETRLPYYGKRKRLMRVSGSEGSRCLQKNSVLVPSDTFFVAQGSRLRDTVRNSDGQNFAKAQPVSPDCLVWA